MAQHYRRQITVQETAGLARHRWPVVITLDEIARDVNAVNWRSISLTDADGRAVPYQVDRFRRTGYSPDDEIAFQINIDANERKTLLLAYDSFGPEVLATTDTDLSVSRDGDRLIIENRYFLWELTDGENAEVRVKAADGPGPSWNARTVTLAGDGARLGECEGCGRARTRLATCEVMTAGPVRAIVDLHYDNAHCERNTDVLRRLIVCADWPFVEKVSTSVLGEDHIVMATLAGKLGPRALADMTYCGADRTYAVSYPRHVPRVAPVMRETPMGPPQRHGPDGAQHLGQVEGYTWGAIWNPDTGFGKAEIARADTVAGFTCRWEPAPTHSATDRALADFAFACGRDRTFQHFQVFLDLNQTPDIHAYLNRLTQSVAHPLNVTVGIEALADTDSPLAIAPSEIICDLTGGSGEFDVALPIGKTPGSLVLHATGDLPDYLDLPDTTGPFGPGDRCRIGIADRDATPAGVISGTVDLTINDKHGLSVPVTLIKSEHPPHGEVLYGPVLPTGLDPIRFEIHATAETWLERVEITWQRNGQDRFTDEYIFGPKQHEAEATFEIPPQRPGSDIRCTISISDVHGRVGGLALPLHVLDATLDCTPVTYVGEDLPVSFKIGNPSEEVLTAEVRLLLDDEEVARQSIAAAPGHEQIVRGAASAGQAGTRTIQAFADVDGRLAVLSRQVNVVDRPSLPYEDFVAMLARPDKRTLHGNLVRYWGGQICPEYELAEPETLGLTHPWYVDGTCPGGGPDRDREFWRDEFVAYGLVRDTDSGKLTIYPPVAHVHWQPGQMDCHYHLDDLTVRETKFISNHDVFADVIHLENASAKPKRFSLLFKGRGHGLAEGYYDAQREAVIVENHADSYTDLTEVFYASRPFDIAVFEATEAAIDQRIRDGELFCCGDRQYGAPAWYVFGFEIELAPGETTEIVLGLAIGRDLSADYHRLRSAVASPDAHLEAVRWKWNHWLNYEVPRFDCSDPAWRELYYYLYFCYRANLLDVGRGFAQAPYVAPAAATRSHVPAALDSALHVWVGRWLADPAYYTYGNLTNWALVQEPCGFCPEYFGLNWHVPWAGEHAQLQSAAMLDLYRHTGDADLVQQMLPPHAAFDAWRACEVERSPYWAIYHANVPDWAHRRALAEAGEPWTDDNIDYYERLVALAEVTGDKEQHDRFTRKLTLCRQRTQAASDAAGPDAGIAPNQPSDVTPIEHGHWLYGNHAATPNERIERFLACLADPNQLGADLLMPAQSLQRPRRGHIEDFGTSVAGDFFITEGLFRAGYDRPALDILTRLIDASFLDLDGDRRPIAPECWNEKAQPWWTIEHASNGLINDFLLYRVVGLAPNVAAETLTIQPHLPDHLTDVEATIPLPGGWPHVVHHAERAEGLAITTTVADATLKTVELRYRIPAGLKLAAATVDGQDAKAAEQNGAVTFTVTGKADFEVAVQFVSA